MFRSLRQVRRVFSQKLVESPKWYLSSASGADAVVHAHNREKLFSETYLAARHFMSGPTNAPALNVPRVHHGIELSSGPLPRRCLLAARNFSSLTPSSSEDTGSSSFSAISMFLLALPAAITFGLGSWQMQRSYWKNDLLAFRNEQLMKDPIRLGDITGNTLEAGQEFQRVWCEGEVDMSQTKFIGPRVKSVCGITKKGYLMVSPLYPSDGSPPALVNRGWVPSVWRERHLAGDPVEKGKVYIKVAGVLRESETASSFVPDNTKDDWFWMDVPGIARSCGLSTSTLLLDLLTPPDVSPNLAHPPVGRTTDDLVKFSVMPIGHYTYAATWYALSGALTFMCYKLFKQRGFRRSQPRR